MFGDSIAAELRTFSEVERCRIKHEINDILFSHQMKKFQGTPAMRIQNFQVRTSGESSYPYSSPYTKQCKCQWIVDAKYYVTSKQTVPL